MPRIDSVLVTNRLHPEVRQLIQRRFRVIANEGENPWPAAEIVRRASDVDAILAFMTDTVTDEMLAMCPHLKIVAGALKGSDNFDVDSCTRRGVWLTVVPDLLTAPTAELAVGLAINIARNIAPADQRIRLGGFSGWRPWFYGGSLNGARVGLIGMGAVGRGIAQRLIGFETETTYFDLQSLSPQVEHDLRCCRVDMETLVGANEFVIVAAPLTTATLHLIDAACLRRFHPDSYLINVSRGSVVCEAAVRDALKTGVIAGYAADVFECEDWTVAGRPSSIDEELLSLTDRTLFTPHLGSAVRNIRRAIEMEAAMNIVDCSEGRVPRGAINNPAVAH